MNIKEIYSKLIMTLPHEPKDGDWHGYWYNETDDEIMCPEGEAANVLADFFEDCGIDIMHTHFYNEQENAVNDNCYGFWSVYVDGQ